MKVVDHSMQVLHIAYHRWNVQTLGIVYHLRRKNMNIVIQITKYWPTTYYNNMFVGSKLPFLVVHFDRLIQ